MTVITKWRRICKKIIKRSLIPLYFALDKKINVKNFYTNIGVNPLNENQKRVLISYITTPLEWKYSKDSARHTSLYEASIIIYSFLQRGYCVDVINCDDVFHLEKLKFFKYDVVFGFGDAFYVACKDNPRAKKIIYLTESAPEFSEKREQERNDYLYERKGVKLPLKRTGKFFKKDHIQCADCGILIGNEVTNHSYLEYYPDLEIKTIAPSGLNNPSFVFNPQKELHKHVFLWFASAGIVHKGLDVLVDAFKSIPEAVLLICGMPDEEEWILADYKRYKNIRNMGFVDVQSQKFLDIVDKACFAILPSASEGMSTAVLTCMRHGLIPVVTKECGIAVDDCGFYCEDYHVEYTRELIKKLMGEEDVNLMALRKVAFEKANRIYTLEAFQKRFSEIVNEVLGDNVK